MKNDRKLNLNRQALRSQRFLQEALIGLLKEKPYRKITISDISDRADLARPTFYAHFNTKDDLLLSYVDGIFEQIFDQLLAAAKSIQKDDPTGEAVMINLFKLWQENGDILRLVRTADIDMLILGHLREYHRKTYLQTITVNPEIHLNPVLAGYIQNFLASTTVALLAQWMDEDMRHSPECMGKLLHVLTGPAIFHKVVEGFEEVIT